MNGIENIDYVKCQICGKCQKCITKHLKKHDIMVSQYKINYPKSDIECLNSKKLRASNRKNTIIKKYGVGNFSQEKSYRVIWWKGFFSYRKRSY